MSNKVEINAEALELNIEKAADDVLEAMLSRAQEAEANKRAPKQIDKARIVRISKPFNRLISMMGMEPLNRREIMAVHALMAYVAHNQNVKQDLVETVVEAEFGVNHIAKIQRMDFQRAIDFLIDLRLNELRVEEVH